MYCFELGELTFFSLVWSNLSRNYLWWFLKMYSVFIETTKACSSCPTPLLIGWSAISFVYLSDLTMSQACSKNVPDSRGSVRQPGGWHQQGWNTKPHTLLPPQRYRFNNTWTSSLYEIPRNQLGGSCPSTELETSCSEDGREICGTPFITFLLLLQCHEIRRKLPAPGFSVRRLREDWTIHLKFWMSWRPAKALRQEYKNMLWLHLRQLCRKLKSLWRQRR